MNKIKLTIFAILLVSSLIAQDLSRLTPEQLEVYKKYQVKNSTKTLNSTKENVEERTEVAEAEYNTPKVSTNIYGSQIFSGQNLTFEPKLNIATPAKYILGTYDELLIDISGLYEANYKLKVSPEGTIRIPNVGPIKVSGLAMKDAIIIIRNRVSKIFAGVSTDETHVNVTLGNIRSIRVTVVGEAVRPGTYTLPSLATAFNALYACGGPDSLGSMRDIKVIRSGKIVANMDVYRFLLDGVLTDNISLQDEDVIQIEPYKVRVSIFGAVKHGGIFEALPNETLQNLIRFAGGFTDNAYKAKINNIRLTEKGKTVIDVNEAMTATFKLQSGDSYTVSINNNKYDNRIEISGSVFRPGSYALEVGLTLKKLIAKAEGVKEDAYMNMAYITRKQKNQIPEIVGFNLGEVLNGTAPDILLQKDDSIKISSLFDYREVQTISVWGAVKSPGTFPLIEKTTLKDLIYKANGFLEMASTDSVELIRVIKDPQTLRTTNKKTKVMKFALDKNLNFTKGSSDILLENGDQVIIRTISGYEGIRMVRVDGEVLQPGTYNITNKAERISDLIKRAGGFTNYAYPYGAFLIRSESASAVEQKLKQIMAENAKKQLQTKTDKSIDLAMLKAAGATTVQGFSDMDSIQKNLSGSKVVEDIFSPEGIVGINLSEIMKNPNGKYDLNLEEGDVVFVPRELQTIRVLGEVLFPTFVRYDRAMSFKDYVSNAGGFSERAHKSKAFVLYANGTARSTKNFLGIKFYPTIKPGARIVVPEKPIEIKNKMSTGETISLMTSITSVVALIYYMIK